jgi:hypothetical protein
LITSSTYSSKQKPEIVGLHKKPKVVMKKASKQVGTHYSNNNNNNNIGIKCITKINTNCCCRKAQTQTLTQMHTHTHTAKSSKRELRKGPLWVALAYHSTKDSFHNRCLWNN